MEEEENRKSPSSRRLKLNWKQQLYLLKSVAFLLKQTHINCHPGYSVQVSKGEGFSLVGFKGIKEAKMQNWLPCVMHNSHCNHPFLPFPLFAPFGKYTCSCRAALKLLEDPQVGWLLCTAPNPRADISTRVSFTSHPLGSLLFQTELLSPLNTRGQATRQFKSLGHSPIPYLHRPESFLPCCS